MRNRSLIVVGVAAVSVLALSGCVFVGGPLTTVEREIDDATAVQLKTGGDIVITLGDSPSLTITGVQGVINRITSEVHDGVLVLDIPGPTFGLGEIDYALTLPSISAVDVDGSGDVEVDFAGASDVNVEISGSGDVEGENIAAGEVSVEISGSGNVDLSGTTSTFNVSIDGSGDVEADDLEATDATVDISGAGEVSVRATGTLDVKINGSGTVRHSGGAELTTDISGSGEVIEGGTLTIVSKTSPYTYLSRRPLLVAPEAGLDTPLSVTVVKVKRAGSMLSLGAAALLSPKMLHRHPNVEHRDGVTGLTITDAEPFPYQVDGDYLGEVNRLDFAYEPDVLTIVVP